MISWIPYVFVRIVFFFMGGILLGIYCPDIIPESVLILILLSLLLAYTGLYAVEKLINKRIINQGIFALTAVFFCGHLCLLKNTDSRNPDHLIWTTSDISYYQVVVTQNAQEKERSWKLEGDVIQIDSGPVTGKILIYLSKEDFTVPYHYGDVLLIRGSPQRVPPPSNPGEFDYRRFLAYKKIYHQHFLRKGDVKFIRNDPPYTFMQQAINVRMWADSTLKKHVHGPREQATATALVLGVTDGLDNELLNAYAATGAMHVLAVSGLHISIIYLIIAFVLRPLNKIPYGKVMLAVISIVLLWAYSFVTGLSPSVLRAVVMFSFMAMARASNRQTNIYNTLAAAAFCLLLYEPYMIMSVGFQLSFLAVLGIVYLQPLIHTWWEPRTWLMSEVWKVTCVSIAAQVSTFPLGLLYFHQFPNYFLLSNLFVIPGSFVVLLAGIGVLAFSFIEPIALALGFLLEWTIRLLNWIVFVVEAFPFSLVENINLTTLQCWILMMLTLSLVLLLVKRRLWFLKTAVALGILFSATQWSDYFEQVDSRQITVYKVPGHSAIDLIDGHQTVFWADSAMHNDHQRMRFHVNPNRLLHDVKPVENKLISSMRNGCQLIVWKGRRILRVTDRKAKIPGTLVADMLIVSNNAIRDVSVLPGNLRTIPLILDSSNSFYFADKFLKQAAELKLDVYSVLHQGAYNIELKPQEHEVHNL